MKKRLMALLLCLLAAAKRTGLKMDLRGWLLAPGLGAAVAGLNGTLLLRLLETSGVPEMWTVLACLLFGGGLYLLVQWLLQNDEQND